MALLHLPADDNDDDDKCTDKITVEWLKMQILASFPSFMK